MKKNILFLMLLSAIIITGILPAKAMESSFYEAEYIDNIWMNKITSNDKSTIKYQKARFFRETSSNKFAYCIEPEAFFQEGADYSSTDYPYNLSSEQINKIQAIAHFGYKYDNHQEDKWYAITQLMIWKEADPLGDYYFTDSLNGNRINIFTNETNEINTLVSNYFQEPSFSGKTIEIVNGKTAIIEDTNNVLSNYNKPWTGEIIDNKLIIDTKKFNEGDHQFTLKRKFKDYQTPTIFFQSTNSQNIVIPGNIPQKEIGFNLRTFKTKLEINKIDADSKNSLSSGKASLTGTTFKLYKDNQEVGEIIIDEDGYGIIESLDFGKYTLKETKAGTGYKLSDKVYEIEITKDNTNIQLTIENEIIKKEIIIHKEFGTDDNFKPEENILFNVYDEEDNLITTLATDNNGEAKITLPYGKYKIVQVSTTEGYEKVNPIIINIEDEEVITYNLKDYKINVPNTRKNLNIIELIVEFIINILC